MRVAAAAVLLLVAAASCGDDGAVSSATVTVPAVGTASPREAVNRLLAVLSDVDGGATARLVPDSELIVLIATENALTVAEIAALTREGVPSDLRDSYWRSFGESFREFTGLPLDDLEVQDVVEFAAADRGFAVVEVGFPTRIGSAYLVTQKEDPGGWHVDLVATLAPSLLRPIRSLVTELPETEDGDAVRAVFTSVVPSFRAVAESPVEDQVTEPVRREIEALVRFISPAIENG